MKKFIVKKTKKGEFRFLLKADNNETIATSENYKNKNDCLATIELVKNCSEAEIILPMKTSVTDEKE